MKKLNKREKEAFLYFAYQYKNDVLFLPELVKFFIIAADAGLLSKSFHRRIGYNDIDNRALYDGMVLLYIDQHNQREPGKSMTYQDMADALSIGRTQAGAAVRRCLIADESENRPIYLERKKLPNIGQTYTVLAMPLLPAWLIGLVQALVEIEYDPALAARLEEEHGDKGFSRGLEALLTAFKERTKIKKK